MGVASNEAEEASASSLFCVKTHARTHALVMSYKKLAHAQSNLYHYDRLTCTITSVDAKHHGASLSERWNVTWVDNKVHVHIKLQLSKSKCRHSLDFG